MTGASAGVVPGEEKNEKPMSRKREDEVEATLRLY
jgi:hypothetical protein